MKKYIKRLYVALSVTLLVVSTISYAVESMSRADYMGEDSTKPTTVERQAGSYKRSTYGSVYR